MARIDKYEPNVGGFRAPLAADYVGSATPVAVSLNASGRVVLGAVGNTNMVGVLCKPDNAKAGDIVDIMTSGELVEFAGAAGTVYYASATTGAISTTAPTTGANGYRVGWTVEATRLVVRFQQMQGT